MRNVRFAHTATLLDSGKVLVVGYYSSELYNPVGGTWSFSGYLQSFRIFHTATRLNTGKILVAGDQSTDPTAISRADLYDPVMENWTITDRLKQGRHLHTATLLMDGRVLVVGGGDFVNKRSLSSAEIYDPFRKPISNSNSLQLLLMD